MISILIAVVGLASIANADDKLVRRHAGHIVISPDPVPEDAAALAEFVKLNLAKDRNYDLYNGPPWDVNLVAFLSRDPGREAVTFRISDAKDPKQTLVVSRAPTRGRLVIMSLSATTAAGFEVGKTYSMRMTRGKTVLARCELLLRQR
ncbi:MAG: hypothetical protein H0T42_25055 [Deltaproteobacteria bacterium]|nr:hypothetical protein [Deltaproteobacteria bacterium]